MGFCGRHGKSYLTRRRRGEEGGGGGSVTGGSLVLARFVEVPVRIEVAAGAQRPQLQHRLGADQPPAGAGQLHPVAHQVPAGPFDHAGGDGVARREVAVVVQIRRVLQQGPTACSTSPARCSVTAPVSTRTVPGSRPPEPDLRDKRRSCAALLGVEALPASP